MSIRRQVMWALGMVGGILVAAIGVSLYEVRETQRLTGHNLEVRAPALLAARELLAGVDRSQAQLAAQLVRPDGARVRARAAAWLEDVEPALARLEVLTFGGDAAQLQELRSLAMGLRTVQEETEQRAGSAPQAAAGFERSEQHAERIRALVQGLVAGQDDLLKRDAALAREHVAGLLVLHWLLLGSGLVAAGFAGSYIGRTVRRRISAETGELMGSVAELRTSSHELSSGATAQVTCMSEFSTTIRELANASVQIVERCRQVARQSEAAVLRCQDGGHAVAQAQEVVDAIKAQIEKVVHHMLELGSKSQEINLAADVITELAEQTTILSYNAAIEAAAAGEAGRSFAVVADQVGRLSDRAKEAVRDVRALIADIQRSSNTTIMATEDGLKAAERGREVQADAGEKMEQIIDVIQNALDSIREIEMSATQQSTAALHVNVGIESAAAAAKRFETSARQCLQLAGALTRSAENLNDI
jgi:hypothetical protein